jgi:hypothetical protein
MNIRVSRRYHRGESQILTAARQLSDRPLLQTADISTHPPSQRYKAARWVTQMTYRLSVSQTSRELSSCSDTKIGDESCVTQDRGISPRKNCGIERSDSSTMVLVRARVHRGGLNEDGKYEQPPATQNPAILQSSNTHPVLQFSGLHATIPDHELFIADLRVGETREFALCQRHGSSIGHLCHPTRFFVPLGAVKTSAVWQGVGGEGEGVEINPGWRDKSRCLKSCIGSDLEKTAISFFSGQLKKLRFS